MPENMEKTDGNVNFYAPPVEPNTDRECPVCGEAIDLIATVCPHCQTDVARHDELTRPKVPGGVKALAYLDFISAIFGAFGLVGIVVTIGQQNQVLMWVSLATSIVSLAIKVAIGVAYLKGFQWAWWYTIGSAVMVLVSTSYSFLLGMSRQTNLPPNVTAEMIMVFQLIYAVVALAFLIYFRTSKVKRYFLVKNTGWFKILGAVVIVYAIQYSVTTLPTLIIKKIYGAESLDFKMPDGTLFRSNAVEDDEGI
jgi:hypothetical protein